MNISFRILGAIATSCLFWCKFAVVLSIPFLSKPAISATFYGIAQSDWVVSDQTPAGATVEVLPDGFVGSPVVITRGNGTRNSYVVGGLNVSSGWDNRSEFLFSWSMQTTNWFNLGVRVETEFGMRYLRYSPSSRDLLLNNAGTAIRHGLGASSRDGEWRSWSRDLRADLAAGEPGNTLLAVHGVVIRGDVAVTRLAFSENNKAPSSAIDAPNKTPPVGSQIVLNAENSSDDDGTLNLTLWRNAEGEVLSDTESLDLVLTTAGPHRFILDVTDDGGLSAVESVTLEAVDPTLPTVYSDAESGTVDGWRVLDSNPAGATVTLAESADGGHIALSGSGKLNSYVLGATSASSSDAWNNTNQHVLSLRIKANEDFAVYARVLTSAGLRYIYFDNRDISKLSNGSGTYVHHALGSETTGGQWLTITRDLTSDLEVAQPGNVILAVHGIMVRGSVHVDDVQLMQLVPVPGVLTLLDPADSLVVESGHSQVFTWRGSSLATAYDLRLVNDETDVETVILAVQASDICDVSQLCSYTLPVELPDGGAYRWGVRAANDAGVGVWSERLLLVDPLISAVPVSPQLVAPQSGATVTVDTSVTFTWHSVDQATHYHFELVDEAGEVTDTQGALTARELCVGGVCALVKSIEFPADSVPTWRVAAYNRLGSSLFSEASFSMVPPPPLEPILTAPADNVDLTQFDALIFSWQASEGATDYNYRVRNASDDTVVWEVPLAADAVCLDGGCAHTASLSLTPDSSYFWSVEAGNSGGLSEEASRYFSVLPAVPVTPAVVSPVTDAVLETGITVSFSWEPSAFAESYDFQILGIDGTPAAELTGLLADDICSQSLCEVDSALTEFAGEGHRWRVRAVNGTAMSLWAERSFSTVRLDPTAAFTVSRLQGLIPFDISVDGAASTDDTGIVNYHWAFADEAEVQGNDLTTSSHTFEEPGSYEIVLTVTDGDGRSDQWAVTVTALLPQATAAEAARFLTQSTFGPTLEDIVTVRELGLEGWIDEQLLLQGPPHLDYVNANSNGSNRAARHRIWWLDAVDGEDQLRQRVAFALSQLFVISDTGYTLGNAQYGVTNYYDILRNEAFGNYRELLEQVTLSPVMGVYLSMLQNDKSRPESNTRADENFAREVLQLFSIGLFNLEPNGIIAEGNSFTQAHVEAFARVFTGWNFNNAGDWDRPLFTGQDMINPMEPFEDHHDTDEKTLLNGVVLPAGQTARVDLEAALDNIFAHANVGPFIATHLIKQLVTSNPSPAYVERVASVFNDNGLGVRGDLGATVKAILLDTEARDLTGSNGFGKMREPVLRLSHLWRAFDISPGNWAVEDVGVDNAYYDTYSPSLIDLDEAVGQAPLRSPSVFNFFSPTYRPPGVAGDAWLNMPEMQIFTDSNVLRTATRINEQIYRHFLQATYDSERNPAYLDFSREIALADNPQVLLDHLNILLLNGAMSTTLNTILSEHLHSIEVEDNDDLILRVQDAIALIVASPEYLVQQ